MMIVFRLTLAACLCVTSTLFVAPPAEAGAIERACRNSNRSAAEANLCRCIQQVAEGRLTKSEQRTVSKWFADPHRAQEVRQSARSSDARLWKKYKVFGSDAERICG
ncbi:hypothetical protein [Tritonibacter mobilis]|uniref:hypothetical protein n=1 Tax=Tritonibacter mobilis TaxID=379347 RepID=UPI0039A5A27D